MAALIIAKKKPSFSEDHDEDMRDDSDDEDENSDAKDALAGDMIAALNDGNERDFSEALESFIHTCKT